MTPINIVLMFGVFVFLYIVIVIGKIIRELIIKKNHNWKQLFTILINLITIALLVIYFFKIAGEMLL
jgi:uncharacterized protein involved in cysteine biosynthesis